MCTHGTTGGVTNGIHSLYVVPPLALHHIDSRVSLRCLLGVPQVANHSSTHLGPAQVGPSFVRSALTRARRTPARLDMEQTPAEARSPAKIARRAPQTPPASTTPRPPCADPAPPRPRPAAAQIITAQAPTSPRHELDRLDHHAQPPRPARRALDRRPGHRPSRPGTPKGPYFQGFSP